MGTQIDPKNVIVYCGPTLSSAEVQKVLPGVRTAPPVRREDLIKHRAEGVEVFVMLDGLFLQSYAVAPSEVVDVAHSGAAIVGASSMGALRGAECWPVGVVPIGLVARAYRMGLLATDDEVAVSTDEKRDSMATSVALINVRYACSVAKRTGLLSADQAACVVDAASKLHFTQRVWPFIFNQASKQCGDSIALPAEFLEKTDIKRIDAFKALSFTKEQLRNDAFKVKPGPQAVKVRTRYAGKDPTYGIENIDEEVFRWLVGSGRYARYAWRLLAGQTEKRPNVTADEQEELLFEHMREVCANPVKHIPRWMDVLRSENEETSEKLRFAAVRRLVELAERNELNIDTHLPLAKEQVSIAHGAFTWGLLADSALEEDGLIMGAIPIAWAEEAARKIAAARAQKEHFERFPSSKVPK